MEKKRSMTRVVFWSFLFFCSIAATHIFAQAGEIAVDLPGGVVMEMVWIEPGVFAMGSPDSEPGRDPDEPQFCVLDLSRHMTMLAIARHLRMGWDLVKEIIKNLGMAMNRADSLKQMFSGRHREFIQIIHQAESVLVDWKKQIEQGQDCVKPW